MSYDLNEEEYTSPYGDGSDDEAAARRRPGSPSPDVAPPHNGPTDAVGNPAPVTPGSGQATSGGGYTLGVKRLVDPYAPQPGGREMPRPALPAEQPPPEIYKPKYREIHRSKYDDARPGSFMWLVGGGNKQRTQDDEEFNKLEEQKLKDSIAARSTYAQAKNADAHTAYLKDTVAARREGAAGRLGTKTQLYEDPRDGQVRIASPKPGGGFDYENPDNPLAKQQAQHAKPLAVIEKRTGRKMFIDTNNPDVDLDQYAPAPHEFAPERASKQTFLVDGVLNRIEGGRLTKIPIDGQQPGGPPPTITRPGSGTPHEDPVTKSVRDFESKLLTQNPGIDQETLQAAVNAFKVDAARGSGHLPHQRQPAAAVPQPPATKQKFATNPQTGERAMWNGSAWVPAPPQR